MTDPSTPPKSPGRPGLQRKDVADAIDALVERGNRDPSLAQLRQHLGRGSNGTISRLRNEIRGERLLATRTPVAGSVESSVLPVLVSAMERLGEEAAKAADDQIEAMRSSFEAAQSTMGRERDAALAAAHDIRIELAARADQVKDLRETIKALRAETADEKRRCERAESARQACETQVHSLSVELKGLNEAAERDQALIQELRDAQAVLERRAIEAEQRQAAADASATATIGGLESRLADQQRVIDSLIEKVGA